jgi:hypothetical protein
MNWIDSFQYHFGLAKSFIQTFVYARCLMITAEFLPKFFSNLCQHLNQVFAIPAYVFYILFYLISSFFYLGFWFYFKEIFGSDGDQVQLYFSKIELGNYIVEQSTVDDDDDVDSKFKCFKMLWVFWVKPEIENRNSGDWLVWYYGT